MSQSELRFALITFDRGDDLFSWTQVKPQFSASTFSIRVGLMPGCKTLLVLGYTKSLRGTIPHGHVGTVVSGPF